jgi:cytochrome c-type biogenesis protein CcmH
MTPLLKFSTVILLAIYTGLSSMPSAAQTTAIFEFSQPEYKDRYYAVIDQLRCLVCQNQPLADSHAELAQDLRRQVYEMIESGASDEQILDFMVQRYGDFVLYEPPVKKSTLVLWFAPFIVLVFAGITLVIFISKLNRTTPTADVSESLRRRVAQLLAKQEKKGG